MTHMGNPYPCSTLSTNPAWHVHSHKAKCFSQYAPNFIPGAGQVNGEIMETLWSSLNVVSPSAQGMATPYQQELLDFQMNDSNFLKMVQMCRWIWNHEMQWPAQICTALVLWKKLQAAQTRLALVKESFAELDNGVPPELQQKWVQQEMTALVNQILDPKAMDIFEVQLQKGENQTRGIDLMLISTPQHPNLLRLTWYPSKESIGVHMDQ